MQEADKKASPTQILAHTSPSTPSLKSGPFNENDTTNIASEQNSDLKEEELN